MTWELSGFQALKQESVRLTVGFTARVDQTMQIGSVTETLTVTAESPLVDVTATATVTDLTTEEVRLIPTNQSGLKAFFTQVPGVRSNIEVGNSGSGDSVQFRVYGQSAQAARRWRASSPAEREPFSPAIISSSMPGGRTGPGRR